MAIKQASRTLSYLGVTAKKPPNLFKFDRDPTNKDFNGYNIGDLVLHARANRLYILVSKAGGISTWKILQTEGGGDDIKTFTLDDGNTVTPGVTGSVTISGGSNIETYKIGDHELGIKTPANLVVGGSITTTIINAGVVNAGVLTVASLIGGGLVRATVTGTLAKTSGNDGEIYVGSSTGAPSWTTITAGEGITVVNTANNIEISGEAGNDGEVLIGATGAAPVLNTLTAGPGIIITNAANSITISATSGDNDLLVGTIIEFAGPIPAGASWLECDGSSVLQATYSDLFSAIGQRYLSPTFTNQVHPFLASTVLLCVDSNGQAGANSLWVVAGTDNNLGYSQDGVTWTSSGAFLPATEEIEAVAHNKQAAPNGLWAILSSDTAGGLTPIVRTSPDGITWTSQYSPAIGDLASGYQKQLAHNGLAAPSGLWVARDGVIATQPTYVTSPDGITWTQRTIPVTAEGGIIGLAYKNGIWVAILLGDVTPASDTYNYVYYSSDGALTWTKSLEFVDTGGTAYRVIRDVIATDDEFMITIGNASSVQDEIYVSPDGATWISYQSPLGYQYNGYSKCLAYNDGLYMAGSYETGKIATTVDYRDDWNLAKDITPAVGTAIISAMASNRLAGVDGRWAFVSFYSGNPHIHTGQPSINTTTHFYLPNMPGSIILF